MSPARAIGSAPTRVLHVVDSLGIGGAQVLLAELCTARDETRQVCGHEVVRLHGDGPHVDRLRSNGIVTRKLSSSKFFLHEIIPRLASRLRCHDYEILHLHLPASTLIGTLLARLLTDKPVFVTIYSAKHQMRWPAYNAFRLIAPLVSKIITVLPVSRADLTSIGVSDDKIVFVPMGLDFAGANPFRHDEVRHALGATYGFDPQRPLLLSVARLARNRHIHLLVDAMTYISKTRPNALLLMVGDGNQRANLERSVERRGLQRNIIFGKPRLDVWNVLPGCDVYLTMAAGHGTGIAALQAMACARPVAAYNMGAMQAEHELQTGQGMFIAARDARALARVVCGLIDDREKSSALGVKAREHVIERTSLRAMITSYEKLYVSCAHPLEGRPNTEQSCSVSSLSATDTLKAGVSGRKFTTRPRK